MSWAKLDDSFYDHPKVRPLSIPAAYLWLCSIAYCARHLTDGVIKDEAAELLISVRKAGCSYASMRDELIDAKLWYPAGEDGVYIHDYLAYNPPRMKVLAERSAAVDRMKKKRSGNVRANKSRSSGEVRKVFGRSSSSPSPSPSPEEKNKSKSKTRAKSALFKKPPKPKTWATPEQQRQLGRQCIALEKMRPAMFGKVEHVLRIYRQQSRPVDVLIDAFASALKHEATDPAAYTCKILKIEEPNYHEARHIAAHQARKEEPAAVGELLRQMAGK